MSDRKTPMVAWTRSKYPLDFQEWISTDRDPQNNPLIAHHSNPSPGEASPASVKQSFCVPFTTVQRHEHSHTRNDIHTCASNISGQDRYQINVLLVLVFRYAVI
ncbi:hypothetical protein N7501_009119 [Penicillium viridicatum]|nr:hypothetical protein N7501_009119 [Penicillium viridicatum]